MIYALDGQHPVIAERDTFIAENASIIGSVEIAEGASVWFSAVIRGDNDWIRIGRGANIQDGSVLHTDPGIELIVGENVTVGHRVVLHGCEIGANSLIGIGSTILNRAKIGANTLVGANALVTEGKSFPDGVLLTGSPATIRRKLDADEIAMLEGSAAIYRSNGRRYASKLDVIDR